MNEKMRNESIKAFEDAIFYHALDTFYVKTDPDNDDYSLIYLKNEEKTYVFRLKSEYFEEKAFVYDLNCVYIDKIKE